MKRMYGVAMLFLMTATNVHAYQSVGPVNVIYLYGRNQGFVMPAGNQYQGMYFGINTSISGIACASPSPTTTFFVPRYDPSDATFTKDNPSYRDYVTTLTLAQTLGRTVTMYVDGCVYGYPRLVGLDLN